MVLFWGSANFIKIGVDTNLSSHKLQIAFITVWNNEHEAASTKMGTNLM